MAQTERFKSKRQEACLAVTKRDWKQRKDKDRHSVMSMLAPWYCSLDLLHSTAASHPTNHQQSSPIKRLTHIHRLPHRERVKRPLGLPATRDSFSLSHSSILQPAWVLLLDLSHLIPNTQNKTKTDKKSK